MDNKSLNAWIMYHEIQQLDRLGFSKSKIATYLKLNWRTVDKYLHMSEPGFEDFLLSKAQKEKLLDPYEDTVRGWIGQHRDISSAQIHDWLKEHHPDLPDVSAKTVYNYTMYIRQKYNLPVDCIGRQYFPVELLPYAEQAQVDFGVYNMRTPSGKQKKVFFFAMVLSRSRMKHVYFLDRPFTAQDVCLAHEQSFEYFQGIPKTIVYDQDRTMVVDENIGDVILTSQFKQYTKSRSFKRHFCRKADPESKGKVENVIQYVKKNFLYHRTFLEIETLNTQAIGWLQRTANALEHNLTKEVPMTVFEQEKPHLNPYTPIIIEEQQIKPYNVRKDNTISYKSNFYSLPQGTYQGSKTQVLVKQKDGKLEIYAVDQNLVCCHQLSIERGKMIINTNHKRDKSKSIDEMMEKTIACFSDPQRASGYLKQIQKELPRYTRDHLQVMIKTLENPQASVEIADKALEFCIKNKVHNAHDFERVFFVLWDTNPLNMKVPEEIKTLEHQNKEKANETPQHSDINDYEALFNQ